MTGSHGPVPRLCIHRALQGILPSKRRRRLTGPPARPIQRVVIRTSANVSRHPFPARFVRWETLRAPPRTPHPTRPHRPVSTLSEQMELGAAPPRPTSTRSSGGGDRGVPAGDGRVPCCDRWGWRFWSMAGHASFLRSTGNRKLAAPSQSSLVIVYGSWHPGGGHLDARRQPRLLFEVLLVQPDRAVRGSASGRLSQCIAPGASA